MFKFDPASYVPYRNKEVLERCRNIKREDMEKHPNPDFKIKITNAIGGIWVSDMVARIMESDYKDQKLTMIIPNPAPDVYAAVAETINRNNINIIRIRFFKN